MIIVCPYLTLVVCRRPSDLVIQPLMGILCTIAQFQKYADQAPEITELSILVSSTSYKNKNVLTTV